LKKILPFFSYLFHPIFVPVFATLFYFFSYDNSFENKEKLFILFQISIITIVIPILTYLLLRSLNKVDSVMIFELSQRKIPLLLQCFLIITLIRNNITIDRYPELHFFFLGALFSTLTALLLLFFKIKASLHMMAISALTVFVIGLSVQLQVQNTFAIALLVFMNGVVASSRLEMKAHTNKELIIGFLSGVIPQVALWFLWL
jgi:hypothetical protein